MIPPSRIQVELLQKAVDKAPLEKDNAEKKRVTPRIGHEIMLEDQMLKP
jgi:hypothetical protein